MHIFLSTGMCVKLRCVFVVFRTFWAFEIDSLLCITFDQFLSSRGTAIQQISKSQRKIVLFHLNHTGIPNFQDILPFFERAENTNSADLLFPTKNLFFI